MYTKHRSTALAVLAAAALAACGASDDPIAQRIKRAQDGGEIVIGAAWPWEALGDHILYGKGMDLAVEELNAAGGVLGRPVKILRMDDQESVDRGRIIALGTPDEVRASNNERVQALLNRKLERLELDPVEYVKQLTGQSRVQRVN